MVDSDSSGRSRTRRAQRPDVAVLKTHLRELSRHRNDEVADAALALLQQIEGEEQTLSAQTFQNIYLDVLRRGRTLPWQHRRQEWRAVKGLATGVLHVLVRRLRDQVKEEHRARTRVASAVKARDGGEPIEVCP